MIPDFTIIKRLKFFFIDSPQPFFLDRSTPWNPKTMQRFVITTFLLIFVSIYSVNGENIIIEKLSGYVDKLPEPIQFIANQSLSLMHNKTIEV